MELLPEGEWKHESAPGGILKVPLSLMQEFIKNFQDRICGEKLPLDYGHEPDDKAAPGWITNLKITKNEDGGQSIFATLDITDPEAQENIQNGSLCYISPQLILGWEDPENGETYNVIRSAALTNYPYIKNMRKIIANFEEIRETSEEVKNMMTEEQIKTKMAEIEAKEKELGTKETKITAKENELTTKEAELSEKETSIAERETKLKEGEGSLETAQAEFKKESEKKDDEEDEKGDEDDGKVKALSEKVETLTTDKEKDKVAFKAVVEELNNVTHELREKKVETKLEELIRNGQMVPAGREALKAILMADKTSGNIELKEEKDGKITRKKVSTAEAVLSFLEKSPAGVKLGQEGIITQRTAVKLAEGLNKLMGMSQAEFNKLEPDVQASLLKKVEGFKG